MRGASPSAQGLCASIGVLVIMLASCATVRIPSVEPVGLDEGLRAWSRVLDRFVDPQGAVDFVGLAQKPADLNRFIDVIARLDPDRASDLFPTPQARLAYRINAYNALSMFGVVSLGIPRTNSGLRKVRFFFLRHYRIAGRSQTLYRYEKQIRDLGDPRVHFALNCMSVSCPRLPRVPFAAEGLSAELDRRAREFFASSEHLVVDHQDREVRVSSILNFYRDEFTRAAGGLVQYINRYRDSPIPLEYSVGFLPYDWTIHQAPDPDEAAGSAGRAPSVVALPSPETAASASGSRALR